VTAGESNWVPPGVDTKRANPARVYDYLLGGTHNFLADQDAARAILAVEPNSRPGARANRAFLGRAVRFMAAQGIRQFLDIGSGIPTEGNVHEIAQQAVLGARVAYVDSDPVAVAHALAMLDGNADAGIAEADLREPRQILADHEVRRHIDLARPAGLLLSMVLHFISDDEDPWRIVATLRDALAPGSYLVICHACRDQQPEMTSSFETVYNSRVTAQFNTRSREQIMSLFDGFTLVEPGLVWIPQWRPDSPQDAAEDPARYWALVGVARYDGTP
jgi:SAM-dependent methyltransferase